MDQTTKAEANKPTEGNPSESGESKVESQSTKPEAEKPAALEKDTQEKAKDEPKEEAKESKEGEEPSKDESEAKEETKEVEIQDFQVPEGVTLDKDSVSELKSIAKDLGLKQEGAQKIAELGVKMSQKWANDLQAQLENSKKEWLEATKLDAEFGGAKFEQNMAFVAKARDAFGSPELLGVLEQSGLGNHPEVVRLLYRVGKTISEDSFVRGGDVPPVKTSKSAAEVLYPSHK